jgi:EmrB/QacA subfamily drug resistance transporter
MSPRKGWTLVLVSLGLFMGTLDTLVVSTAVPVIRHDLHASLADLEWTVNAYNLAFACLLLTGAALGDRFGRRRMFVIGILGFTAASAAAALSPTIGALIAARAVQGGMSALVMPLTLTLISEAFPAEKRGAAIGLWGGISGLGVAAGPVVGGAIADSADWRWIFWINVPIGLVIAPLAARFLTESHGPRPQLDLPGVVLAAAGFFGLTWGLVRSTDVGWGSGEVIGSLVLGAVLVGAFLLWQGRASYPMVPLWLFRSRGFSASDGVAFFTFACLFGSLFMLSQFFQIGLGLSPLQAGLRILPWTATPMIIAPIVGTLADKYGNRPFMFTGVLLQAVGLAWVAMIVSPSVSYGWLCVALIVAGVGISMTFPTVATEVMTSVPLREAGVASGVNSAVREIGGVFGVALAAVVFSTYGGYTTPQEFSDGLVPALWTAAGLSALGAVAAVFVPGRSARPVENLVRVPETVAD